MPLGGAKDEKFSYFYSLRHWGLSTSICVLLELADLDWSPFLKVMIMTVLHVILLKKTFV